MDRSEFGQKRIAGYIEADLYDLSRNENSWIAARILPKQLNDLLLLVGSVLVVEA